MNARTRLKREIIRRRRRQRHEYWPEIFTRVTAPDGMSVRVVLYLEQGGITADYRADGHLVHGAWPPAPAVFSELRYWVTLERNMKCWCCLDSGLIEVCHPSTDALLRWDPCPYLDSPRRHPPAAPVPMAVATVPAHLPGCTGDNALCCPPF